jgi:hypothetical protein
MGPAKREWVFSVLSNGGGVATPAAMLTTSYEKVNQTLAFTDPLGTAWSSVRFDDLTLELAEVATSGTLQYYCHVTLREA